MQSLYTSPARMVNDSAVQTSGNKPNSANTPLDSQSSKPVNYAPSLKEVAANANNGVNQTTETEDSLDSAQQARQQAQQEQQVQQVVSQLKLRDQEVRAHEMAHLAVAGQYARGMSFTYQTGPDGKQYAIGGEVGIDTSPVAGDPQATMDKALIIQRAALAPAEPSSQDRKVAQQATQMLAEARAELMAQQAQEQANTENGIGTAAEGEDELAVNRSQRISGIDENQNNISLNNNQPSPLLAMERNQFDLRMQFAG